MIITQHNDNLRSGLNPKETILTTSKVDPAKFGKLFDCSVDGSIYAQPLVAPGLQMPGHEQPLDVLFVATMHNSVYAFDASFKIKAPLWHQHLADSIALPAGDIGGGNGYKDIVWEIGIISTPVIDTDHQAIYVVTTSRSGANPIHELWKLNLHDGSTIKQVQLQATLKRKTFVSSKQNQRSALTLANNKIYIAFASYGDQGPYNGWILAYDVESLEQTNAFLSTASGEQGGIWQSGQGPAVDEAGNLYFLTGNGSFNPSNGDYGDSVLKIAPNLTVVDYFSPHNNSQLNAADADLGSGGLLLIPKTELCIGGGKEAVLYLMLRRNLGNFNALNDNVHQKVLAGGPDENHIHGSPVYCHGPTGARLYVWAERQNMKSFALGGNGLLGDPAVSESNVTDPDGIAGGNQGMPGGFLSVSSNGTELGTGIVWANHPYTGDANQEVRPGVLRAFDAEDLKKQLWSSRMKPERDDLGNLAKFCCPTIQGGKVYMATLGGLEHKQQTIETTSGTPAFANQHD